MNQEERNKLIEETLAMLVKCTKNMNLLGMEKAFDVLGGHWIYTKNVKRLEAEMHQRFLNRVTQEMMMDMAKGMGNGFAMVGMEVRTGIDTQTTHQMPQNAPRTQPLVENVPELKTPRPSEIKAKWGTEALKDFTLRYKLTVDSEKDEFVKV